MPLRHCRGQSAKQAEACLPGTVGFVAADRALASSHTRAYAAPSSHRISTEIPTASTHTAIVLSPRMSPLPADRETLYEVLAGQVESQNGDEHQSHSIGNLWMVSSGERWTVKAKGE